MMTLFNVGVGIGFAILALLPFLFMRKKWHVIAVLAISLGFGLIGYMLSKNYIYPQYLGWEFEQQIRKQPLFALIEKHHPKEFQEFIEKVKISLNKKEGLDKITAYSTDLTNRIFYQHLQTAPDSAIFVYLKSTLDLYRYLYVIDPRAVVKLENGDDSIPVDLHAFWEDKAFQSLLNQVLQAKQKVIEDSIQSPAMLPTKEMTAPILNNVLDDLIGKYGKDVVRSVFTPTAVKIPPKLAAAVIIDFYASIVGAGEEKAGIVMRHIANLKIKAASIEQNVIESTENVGPKKPEEIAPPKPVPGSPANQDVIPPSIPKEEASPFPEEEKAPTLAPNPKDVGPPAPALKDGPPPALKDGPPPALKDGPPPGPKEDGPPPAPPAPPPLEGEKAPPQTSKGIDPPKAPKDIEAPKLPKGVEIPKTPKEITIPTMPKEIKTPNG